MHHVRSHLCHHKTPYLWCILFCSLAPDRSLFLFCYSSKTICKGLKYKLSVHWLNTTFDQSVATFYVGHGNCKTSLINKAQAKPQQVVTPWTFTTRIPWQETSIRSDCHVHSSWNLYFISEKSKHTWTSILSGNVFIDIYSNKCGEVDRPLLSWSATVL